MPLTGAKGHEDPEMVVVGKENVRRPSLFFFGMSLSLFSSSSSLPLFFIQKKYTTNRINHPLTTITSHWPRVRNQ